MKIITNLILILVSSSAFGEKEVCKFIRSIENGAMRLRFISGTLRHITVFGSNLMGMLNLTSTDLPQNCTIAPYAFNNLDIKFLRIGGVAGTSLRLLPNSFGGIPKLLTLVLSTITVDFRSNQLGSFESLVRLECNDINLNEIPIDMLASSPNLDHLELTKNQIGVIRSNSFASLKSLNVLILSDNGISYIEEGAFNGLAELSVLELSDNDFVPVPGIFQGMPNLNKLYLNGAFAYSKCPLQFGTFDGLPALFKLKLKRNKIQKIRVGTFDNLTSLEKLDLSDNMIEEIKPGTFGRSISAKLILDWNRIQVIEPDTFKGLTAEVLSLQHNRIAELKPGAFNGVLLGELRLASNVLKGIDSDDFQGFKTFKLNLYHNLIQNIAQDALKNVVKDEGEVDLRSSPLESPPTRAQLGLPGSVELIL